MIEKFDSVEKVLDYFCFLPNCDTYDSLNVKAVKVALPIVGALAVAVVGYKLAHVKRRVQIANFPSFPLNPFALQSLEPIPTASPYMGDPVIHVLRSTQKLLLDRQRDLDPTSSFKKMSFPPSHHAIVYLTMLWKRLHLELQVENSGVSSLGKRAQLADAYMKVSFILGSFALDDQKAFTGFLQRTLKLKDPISPSDLLSDKYKEYYPRNLSLVVPEAYRYLKSIYPLQKDNFYEGTDMQNKWNRLYHAYLARRKQVAPDCVDPKLEPDLKAKPFSPKQVIEIDKQVDPHKIFHSVAN